MSKAVLRSYMVALSVLVAGTVHASNPSFKFATEEEAKKAAELKEEEAVWNASASAGMIVTTGNSETTTVNGGVAAARKQHANKFQLNANGAYARSTIRIANDADGSGDISAGEVDAQRDTTAKQWLASVRYDRFLTLKNSVYATGGVGANEPAGKQWIGNGQLGYSREIVGDDVRTVLGEFGYDYAYERLDNDDNLHIHSARMFLGYRQKVTEVTEVASSVEALVNLNTVEMPQRDAKQGQDTRVNGLATLTTKLWEDISFRFAFAILYDNAPAPRKAFDLPYAAGFLPEANKVDTKTEASLIFNFL